MEVSSNFFRQNIVDIAQEAKGSGHPLPVNKAHDSSLSHFEDSKTDFSYKHSQEY